MKRLEMKLQRFARNKNAIRGHFIAPYVEGQPMPVVTASGSWMEIAKYIATVDDETEEETDDTGFYDGDGTPETTVVSVAIGYSFEGFYDSTDAAMAFIAKLKRVVGSGRKVWHMVVSADQSTMWLGRATVTGIVAGSGDATEFEAFECTITYDSIPAESPASGVGVPPNINGSSDIAPTNVTISGAAPSIAVAATVDLGSKLTFTPTTTNVRAGTWASTDKAKATVNANGIVTGVAAGKAIIVFVTQNGIVAQTEVTVTA